MRSINKIWSFLAVGFVLVFAGRVSKASLFTAYVKTIAEVEVRNTQDLEESDSQAPIAILTKVRKISRLITSFAAGWLPESTFILPEPELVSFQIPLNFTFRHTPTHHFYVSAPIRAPGIS